MSNASKRKRDEAKMLTQWWKLVSVVWDYFGLSAEERRQAAYAARRSPRAALRAYRAITNSLRT